jgi:chromosome partitioning protein
MKIITLTGYKGGIGKSCTAVHLATYLSDIGNVLLIDGDPNRTAINWDKRGGLPFDCIDERQAAKSIPGRDYLVIDTPARPDSDDLKELAAGCDLLILPTIPDAASIEPMIETKNDLGTATYRTLVTMSPAHPNRDGEILQSDMIALKIPCFKTIIRRSTSFARATNQGVPIRDLKSPYRTPWADYANLGKEVMEILG